MRTLLSLDLVSIDLGLRCQQYLRADDVGGPFRYIKVIGNSLKCSGVPRGTLAIPQTV